MTVKERMDRLNQKKDDVQVRFFGLDDQSIGAINNALKVADNGERLDLFVALFLLWFDAVKSEQFGVMAREAEIVFGQTFLKFADHRIFFSLNELGSEFRIWYFMPKSLSSGHVDSDGQGLLAEVKGDPISVAKYIKAMIGFHPLTVVWLSNNVRIFLKLEES